MKNLIYRIPGLVLLLWIFTFFVLPFLIISFIALSSPKEAIPPFEPFIKYTESTGLVIKPYFENFNLLFTDVYFNGYLLSIKLAFITMVICLIIGYPMAFFISTRKRSQKALFLTFLLIPFFTSLLLRVYCWVILLKKSGIVNVILEKILLITEPLKLVDNNIAVIIGMVYCYLPFMVLPIYSTIEKLNPRLIEAAQDLGAKNHIIFLKIIVPLTLSGIISGCMLVFIPSIGEFVIPDLLGGSEVMTIGKLIWNEFFMMRNWPMASAMAISLCIFLIIPTILFSKLEKKFG